MKHPRTTRLGAALIGLGLVASATAAAAPATAAPAAKAGTTSLAEVLGADGQTLDKNWQDFDIVEAASTPSWTPSRTAPSAWSPTARPALTVFVPTDAAFRSFVKSIKGYAPATEEKTLKQVVKIAGSIDTVETILLYHVVAGKTLTSPKVLAAEGEKIKTAQGGAFRIHVGKAGVFLVDKDRDAANPYVVRPRHQPGQQAGRARHHPGPPPPGPVSQTPRMTASGVQESRLQDLKRWNLGLALLHAVQAVAIFALATDFSIPLSAAFPDGPPGSALPQPDDVVDISIGLAVALFLLLAAIDHGLTATALRGRYEEDLRAGINRFRWIEYSVSATVMIVLIAMYAGITQVTAIIAIAASNVAMILFGWLQERMNPPGRETTTMLPFWFGCVAGAGPWLAITFNIVGSETVPGFVYGIFVSLFVSSCRSP